MTIYPFPKKIKAASDHMTTGNFGLWYNKFVPLSDKLKTSDDRGNDTEAVKYYFDRYNQMKAASRGLLQKKHQNQTDFCNSFPQQGYEVITIRAMLKTPLVTGIGESHPHEVSMVFDHNLGIPFLPASGVKGIVRFVHTYVLFKDGCLNEFLKIEEKTGREYIDDESCEAIYYLFGNQKNRGNVVFLDAYPENVPDLHIDIMNPHYGVYYSDKEGKTPPADYLSPNPIKFLTVAPGAVFIFRAIAGREKGNPEKVRKALCEALTEEGVGAKTAVGYGRFAIIEESTLSESPRAEPTSESAVMKVTTIEEVWEDAQITYDAGGAGKITARAKGNMSATMTGKGDRENLRAVVPEELHKNLFRNKRPISARVTVRKIGNAWQIVKIEQK
ncbi:MAG TPA: type III-B CRISPR module RAMP protein Cmr6 [Smithellaceae bacterium]|nr:type III-B CRISPR module RAMP protein Cmr6 [Smithellaceae bacterium]HRS90270.1 type III-B CRISPR module RAMP protein Cmr6 [Smithellaceae bacterium]